MTTSQIRRTLFQPGYCPRSQQSVLSFFGHLLEWGRAQGYLPVGAGLRPVESTHLTKTAQANTPNLNPEKHGSAD